MKNKYIDQKAFTLIELLVVISIIGILSSFAVVSLNSARIKARDALRKGDMASLRTAMGLYYFENDGYPICGTFDDGLADFGANVGNSNGDGSWCYNNVLGGPAGALTQGARPIMQELPKDPANRDNLPLADGGDDTYIYRYVSDGYEYAIVYTLEEGGLQVIRGW